MSFSSILKGAFRFDDKGSPFTVLACGSKILDMMESLHFQTAAIYRQ